MGIVVSAAISGVPFVDSLGPQPEQNTDGTTHHREATTPTPKQQYFDRSQYYLHPPSQTRSTSSASVTLGPPQSGARATLKTGLEHPPPSLESIRSVGQSGRNLRGSQRDKTAKKTVTIDEGKNISRADSREDSSKFFHDFPCSTKGVTILNWNLLLVFDHG